jgi:hypothetical protein
MVLVFWGLPPQMLFSILRDYSRGGTGLSVASPQALDEKPGFEDPPCAFRAFHYYPLPRARNAILR